MYTRTNEETMALLLHKEQQQLLLSAVELPTRVSFLVYPASSHVILGEEREEEGKGKGGGVECG
jgi:hypothetical protein